MYDIIIIGAGPAGLTAAIYARRALKNILILEAKTYGGQIISTTEIENYPVAPHISGVEFATKLYQQVTDLGAEIIYEKVINLNDHGDFKEVITPQNTYTAKAVIIATGSDNRKLGLPNETDLVGKGVSYCATCDGAFYKGKTVAVVGGGNAAIEDALYLANIAAKVYLIHRRDQLNGDEVTISRLKNQKNVELIFNSHVTQLIANQHLEQVQIMHHDGSSRTLDVSGLFIAVGRIPENQNFAKIIHLDQFGYIQAGEDCRTNVNGIFAAGDNRVKTVRQLVTATGDGAVAATHAIQYLSKLK